MSDKQVVLVVEDDPINRAILINLIQSEYQVIEAENGQIAMDILLSGKYVFAAILLDIIMPVLNGYGVMEKLHANGMDDIPVIVMTGETNSESERKALDAGAWDFVTKPYDAKILITRINNAIARSKMSAFEEIKHLSEYDSLTELYNRRKMFIETKKMIKKHKDLKFAFIKADIDHFALFNSSFGEQEGDKLLCYFAGILKEFAKEHKKYTCGRINADTFCICIKYDDDKEKLESDIMNMQKKLEEYHQDYLLKMTVGVYIVDDTELNVEELYLRVSLGAQRCKNQFGDVIGYYDAEFGKKLANEIAITNEMQNALDENQFIVYFQPKYKLSTESACGAEALVRWKHPVKGLISPGLFIPVFESNGFIAKVDYFVWEKTCQLLREWIDKGGEPFPVSVNISRISLYNPQLINLLKNLIEKYNISAPLLQLEITESAYMTNQNQMTETIKALHEAGFTILMDDFGSGYSSLNTLKTIEVDILKIDMKFLPTDNELEKGEIILSSVIRMANWIGMSVVVEGVETRRQRDFIESAGCDCVQGYYYSKPIPQEEYEEKYVFSVEHRNAEKSVNKKENPKHNVTILIIDDSEMDRVILEECLKSQYNIHQCDSAESGLAYLQKNKNQVRLILVDNMMPGMTGIDFLKYCQEDLSLQAIPKIMITGDESSEEQIKAFKAGAYDYITKPMVREIVLARIHHVMEINNQLHAYERSEKKYRHQAELDKATGLLNKSAFKEEAIRMMVNQPREHKALMVIDVDNFKMINDQYGHLTGDNVLKTIAEELVSTFRKTDAIGRFGGDEFVIFMPSFLRDEIVKRKAEEVIKSVMFDCMEKYHLEVSISIGIAHFDESDSFDTLFARADQSLYEAKNTGKGRVILYGETVPKITDDDKPIVLICSERPDMFHEIALSYGNSAGFINITNLEELRKAYSIYSKRICVACLDMQRDEINEDNEYYKFIMEHGGGSSVAVMVTCREGDMENLRNALNLNIQDIMTVPPQVDGVKRRLSRAISFARVNTEK